MGKQALYIHAFNLLPKRKQTITGSETCEDTVGPCNQSASETANKHFESNEKDIEKNK